MSQGMEKLGRELRETLGAGPDEARLAAQRAAFLEQASGEAQSSPTRGHPGRWLAVGVLTVAAAAVALFFVGPWDDELAPTLICTVVGGEDIGEGTWLDGTESSTALRFSDGSDVIVEAGARARLSRLSAGRTEVTIEDGEVRSSIVPNQGIVWFFEGGPYRVRVVGTRFRVRWDAANERLTVAVDEGLVHVSGGTLVERLPISGGELLEIDHRTVEVRRTRSAGTEATAEVDGVEQAEPSTEVGDPAEAQEPHEPSEPETRRRRRPRTQPTERGPTWKELAEAGRYREAVEAAEARGFDQLNRTLPAWDLLALGDACRLARRADCGQSALNALRRRFRGHAAAKVAAYRLGRLAFDLDRNYPEAARWFETYLQESPRGRLANEARGRLMESLHRSGRRGRARAVAERYLALEPNGAYAPLARSLTEGPSQ